MLFTHGATKKVLVFGTIVMGEEYQNTFRILIATDNHLGYLERDPIRGNDSFVAFEEVLRCAKEKQVCKTYGYVRAYVVEAHEAKG